MWITNNLNNVLYRNFSNQQQQIEIIFGSAGEEISFFLQKKHFGQLLATIAPLSGNKQTLWIRGCSTNSLVINWFTDSLIESSFSSKFSRHHKFQTIRAWELTFWENFHPPPCVKCPMSHVTRPMLGVTCLMSGVTCQVYFFLFRRSGGVCRLRVCYQWGPPRLVYSHCTSIMARHD